MRKLKKCILYSKAIFFYSTRILNWREYKAFCCIFFRAELFRKKIRFSINGNENEWMNLKNIAKKRVSISYKLLLFFRMHLHKFLVFFSVFSLYKNILCWKIEKYVS